MREFESLCQTGQVRRLKKLAESVLRGYARPGLRVVRLLLHVENTTFEVRDATGRRYCLRVGSGIYHSPQSVAVEADWLAGLRSDLGDIAPCPRTNRDGRLVTVGAADDVPRERPSVLLDWLPGRSFFGRRSSESLRTAGRLLGLLHEHGRRQPGNPDLRWRWDGTDLLGEDRLLGPIRSSTVVTPAMRLVFERTSQVILKLIRQIDAGPDSYGWIHADPHPGNLLMDGATVRAIDFDDCGMGYFAWDLSVLIGRSPQPGRQEAILEGYASVRPVPPNIESQIAVFRAARALSLASWVAERDDNPALRSDAEPMLERWAAWLERNVRGGRCL